MRAAKAPSPDYSKLSKDRLAPRLERGVRGQKQFLQAVFPGKGRNADQVVDLTFLLKVPELAIVFAESYVARWKHRRPRTRSSAAADLREGFVKHLVNNGLTHITIHDISTPLMNEFVFGLNNHRKKSGAPLTYATRGVYLGCVRGIFEEIRASSKYGSLVSPELSIPECCWPLGHQRGRPVPILNDEAVKKLYRSCQTEIAETMEWVHSAKHLLEQGSDKIPEAPSTYRDYPDLATCVATLNREFRDSPPSYQVLYDRFRFLLTAIRDQHGGLIRVRSLLYPEPRMLTPFVLLLAIHTGYNPDTILSLSLDDFSLTEALGEREVEFHAFKPRSGTPQYVTVPLTKDADNPGMIIDFLVNWGKRIRKLAPPQIARRLFLFLPRTNHTRVMTYCDGMRETSATWQNCIRSFCADHTLDLLTLRQLRATTIDLNRSINGGDMRAGQAFANHGSMDVTNTFYNSDAQRQRNAEALGDITQLLERWIKTSGALDPRKLPLNISKESATPGWGCFDPYASPFCTKGTLCTSYGLCPICPLAHLDLSSPYACAQTHNLLSAIRAARLTLTPQAWLARWAPVEAKLLNVWLPRFPDSLREAAKKHFSRLPALPTPE